VTPVDVSVESSVDDEEDGGAREDRGPGPPGASPGEGVLEPLESHRW
jgi:hypothetical protein